MPVHPFDRWITRHVRRVQIGQFLHRLADFGAVFLCVFGLVVLLSKLAIPQLWPHVLWLALGMVPVAALAWWFVVRHAWNRAESVARLDRSLAADGLLMTLSECPDNVWEQRLPRLDALWQEALPRIRPRRFAKNLALPLVFAIAACCVPLRDASQSLFASNSSPASNETKKLEELLEKLNDSPVLEPEERAQIKEELNRLADDAREKPFDTRKWESLDAIRERLRDRIDSASNLTQQAQDAVKSLEEETHDVPLKLSPQEQKQLADLLNQLQAGGELESALKDAPQEVRDSLQKLLAANKPKPEDKQNSDDKPAEKTGAHEETKPGGKQEGEQQEGKQKAGKSGDKKGKNQGDKPGEEKGDKSGSKQENREGKDGKSEGQELNADQQAALQKVLQHLQDQANKDPSAQKAAEKMSQSLQKSSSQNAAKQQRQQTLQKNLAQTLQKLSKRGALDKASPEMKQTLQKLMKRGEKLDLPEDPKEAQQSLSDLRDFLEKENAKQDKLKKESGSHQGEGEGEEGSSNNGKSGQMQSPGGEKPGRGGVTRGRADAEMTWGDEAPKMLNKFKEVELPKGTGKDPKDQIMGITKSAPTEKAGEVAPRGAQRNMDASAGSVTVNHKLSPRHRGVVQRFFEDPQPVPQKK